MQIVTLGQVSSGELARGEDFRIADEKAIPKNALAEQAFVSLRGQLNAYAKAAERAGLPRVETGPTDAGLSGIDVRRIRKIADELPERVTVSGKEVDLRAQKQALSGVRTLEDAASRSVALAQAILQIRRKVRQAERKLSPGVKVGLTAAGIGAGLYVLTRLA